MTLAEIKKRTAYMLGILRIGQALDADKDARIESAYNETYAQLNTEGINTWGATIPDEVVPHVVSIMALNCCDDYGVSPARYQRIVAKANVALREIRKHTTPDYEPLTDPQDF